MLVLHSPYTIYKYDQHDWLQQSAGWISRYCRDPPSAVLGVTSYPDINRLIPTIDAAGGLIFGIREWMFQRRHLCSDVCCGDKAQVMIGGSYGGRSLKPRNSLQVQVLANKVNMPDISGRFKISLNFMGRVNM